jgi:hypothetical protein
VAHNSHTCTRLRLKTPGKNRLESTT